MGADLIVTFLTIEKDKDGDIEAGQKHLETLKTKSLKDWPPEFLDFVTGDETFEDSPNEPAEREGRIEQLTDDLKNFALVARSFRDTGPNCGLRDVAIFEVGPLRVILSGGMSWGDSPTESFDMIERLARSGIAEAMGFNKNANWARIA